MTPPEGTASLPDLAIGQRIQEIVRRFEEAWRREKRPVIADYLPADSTRPAILVNLVNADLKCRLEVGEPAKVEDYLQDFPELSENVGLFHGQSGMEYALGEMGLGFHAGRSPSHGPRPAPGTTNPNEGPSAPDDIQRPSTQAEGTDIPPADGPPVPEAIPETLTVRPVPAGELSTADLLPGCPGGGSVRTRSETPPALTKAGWPAIPGYEVLGELGRGGMGIVYKARQLRLNRVVALKTVLAGAYARPEDLVRFLAEAEAAARHQHPHIVQVHEVGRQGGLPFFSMEFVDGGNLAQRFGGNPLPPHEAACLVEVVALAVDFAHRHGVIHRDLKPANVLLAADGSPKVSDFGLAKRLEGGAGLTESGVVLGTPSYMAPEQAAGKGRIVGPATDVYALGAILYEGITGRPPFRAATPVETVLQVLAEEVVPPSRLTPKLPKDLETICLKCLEKDPARRYASAEALAGDLRRFLEGRPITARPAGPMERGWRWCRRNPVVATLAATLLLALAAGLVGTSWKWREAVAQERVATANLARAMNAERQASEETSRAQSEAATAGRVSDLLSSMFESFDPEPRGRALTVGEVLLLAKDKALAEFKGQPLVRAKLLQAIGNTYRQTGAYAQAEPLLREVLELRRGALGEESLEYALSLRSLASLYYVTGRYTDADVLYNRALAIHRRAHEENTPGFASSLSDLAALYEAMGDQTRAAEMADRALETTGRVFGRAHPTYANSLSALARIYLDWGDYTQAEPLLRQALEVRKRALGERHPDYALSLNNLGMLYQAMGDPAKAEPLLREALDIDRIALGEAHPSYATALRNMAVLYRDTGASAKAEPLLRQALEVSRKSLGEGHPDYFACLHDLGALYRDRGDFVQAEPLLRRALDLCRKELGQSHPAYAACLESLASLDFRAGRHRQAASLLKQSLAIYERLMETNFAAQSGRQRIAFLQSMRQSLDKYFSVLLTAEEPEVAELYRHVLKWKSIAFSTGAGEDGPGQDKDSLLLENRLRGTRRDLADLAFQYSASPEQREGWLVRFRELTKAKENLERERAKLHTAYPRSRAHVDVGPDAIASTLPAATALVEFFAYTHFSPNPARDGRGGIAPQSRLVAFVLRPGHHIVCVPLHEADPITQAIRDWRRSLTSGDASGLEKLGQKLRQRLWEPLQPTLGGAAVVITVPDGELTTLPLAALPGRQRGTYLIEEVALCCASSGRHVMDLMGLTAAGHARGLLAVGGVEYRLARIPETESEVRRCANLFSLAFPAEPALLLTGGEPRRKRSEEELTRGFRYVHLATHGFFESPRRIAGFLKGGRPFPEPGSAQSSPEEEALSLVALLRSGLILAGDEILTAEEVAGLDMRRTELVILSACNTGRGQLVRGVGALGLPRAFHAAGVRSVVASLHSVDDVATSLLMEEFYTNLWQKRLPKLEALRQAQLTILRHPEKVENRTQLKAQIRDLGLIKRIAPANQSSTADKRPRRSPPAWWAAFVLSGDWR